MGLFGGQFSSVVEWKEYSDDIIFWKFPSSEIKKGSRLIIRPGQDAIFMYNGRIEGIFREEGNFDISSDIIPFLSTLKSFTFGFNTPLRAEVLFINTKEFTVKWGTKNAINLPVQGLHFRNFRGRCGMGLQYLSSKRNLVPCWVEHHAERDQSHLQRAGPLPTLWKMRDGVWPRIVPAVIWQFQQTKSSSARGARPLYGDGCSFHPASDSQPQTIPQIKKSLRQTKCSDFFIYDFKKSLMSCAV